MDAADRTWHLSSATPYDPPLTYGGWNQSRALGAHIASLLRMREEEQLDQTGIDSAKARRRKKHRIVIHSSPFERCVQTSIGISAGLAEAKKKQEPQEESIATQLGKISLGDKASQSAVYDHGTRIHTVPEPERAPYRRPLLRIDALLGEWRNPEYFEGITPPPDSASMVFGAKADLLKRGEPVQISSGIDINRGNFPGGWTRSNTFTDRPAADKLFANSLPADTPSSKRERSNSHSSVESYVSRSDRRSRIQRMKGDESTYVAPVPRYAVAPSDVIPPGFVAHARDACIDVDFQWDSMRSPQDWGDGGELGEEWSAMHKRLRKGFQRMIEWYTIHGVDSTPEENPLAFPAYEDKAEDADSGDHQDDQENEDVVLILVTHGAGCNALIGALTNQPVLLDVGMASLTLAVRKETIQRPPIPSRAYTIMSGMNVGLEFGQRRRSSVDTGFSSTYDMKLVASIEHLRPGSNPTKLRIPKSGASASSVFEPSIAVAFGRDGEAVPSGRRNSALGSMRRANTSTTSATARRWHSPARSPTRTESPARPASGSISTTGLWSRTPTTSATTPATSSTHGSESPTGEDFSIGPPATIMATTKREEEETKDNPTALPVQMSRSASQGLWGGGAGVGSRIVSKTR